MNFKRAAGFGLLLWVLIFFEVSILMFGFKLEGTETIFRIVHYIALAVLTVIVSLLYFKKATKGFGEGLLAGIVFVVVEIILDSIITVPLFIKDYGFFLDYYLWIGILETVVVAGIVGALKK